MDKQQYLESLSANISQFREAAQAGLKPDVPACPGWTVGRLVVHLGEVYDFWSKVVSTRSSDEQAVEAIQNARKPDLERLTRPDIYNSSEALVYFDRSADAIQQALSDAEPSQPNWTWWPGNQTAGFVQRRMCHESTIHRWDAQSAHGSQTPVVPVEVAADGIDEELKNELTGWGDEGKTFPNASFHLHCTDSSGEWLIIASGTSVEVRDEHAKADVAITGPTSDILLWLWHRVPTDQMTIHGDADLAPELRDMLEQD